MALSYDDVWPLINRYHQRLQTINLDFIRYLYPRINWDARVVGIKGPQGVGKTTLLLQRIKMIHKNPDDAIYASLDDLWFTTHSLEDFVDYFYSRGIRHFYIDGVHKYPLWSRAIKTLYEVCADIRIAYTGSALLATDHSVGDLSRHQSLYMMWGMSFREYLEYEGIIKLEPVTLPQLLTEHVALAMQLNNCGPVLKHFEDYLRHGYYPFYKANLLEFGSRLAEVVRVVMEIDIPENDEISLPTIAKLKTLMMIIAENAPLEPNISKLSEKLECSRELCLKMLYLLDKAALVQLMFSHPRTYKQMRGPEKVLGGDTNILYALTAVTNVGTLRETFFVNQMRAIGDVVMAKRGDYVVDGRYTFEVGGNGKKFDQIADIPDSYLAVDGVSTGYGARIPLYLFGLLY